MPAPDQVRDLQRRALNQAREDLHRAAGEPSRERDLGDLAHRLAGTLPTLGLPKVGALARSLQRKLAEEAAPFDEELDALRKVVAEALVSLEEPV